MDEAEDNTNLYKKFGHQYARADRHYLGRNSCKSKTHS